MTTLKTAHEITQDDSEYTDFAIYIDNYLSRDYIAEFTLDKTAHHDTELRYRSASLGETYDVEHEPNQVPPLVVDAASSRRISILACCNAAMIEAKANARLLDAAPELLAAAELAATLCKLITRWADADTEDAFGIMDEIVALAQDESQPENAVLKARGAVAPSLARGA